MEQGGFDFQKPSERREARRFEPPPWERDAFEELRQKAGAEEAQHNAASGSEGRGTAEGGHEAVLAEGDNAGSPEFLGGNDASLADGEPEAGAGLIDEARMIEMMAALSSETPRSNRAAVSVTLSLGGLLAVFGTGLAVWGGVLMARAQGTGRLLALVLVVMGLAYLAVGAGLGYRALKERGVL